MKFHARATLVAALVGAMVATWATAVSVPTAQAAFGIKTWEAGTCTSDTPECVYTSPESQFYTQSSGHPPFGITAFEVNTGALEKPEGQIKDVRVDIPPGLSTNPQAVLPKCTETQFNAGVCPAESLVGVDEVTAFVVATKFGPLSLPIYNLEPPPGVPAEFGFNLKVGPVETKILIVGHVSWHHEPETSENSGVPTGDYHEFFTIREISNALSIVKTRLKFNGTAGNGTFLTMPSQCGIPQTSYLHIDSYEAPGQFQGRATVSGEPPRARLVTGCELVPFGPSVSANPGAGESSADQPDGVGVDLHLPHNPNGVASPDSSDLHVSSITLPEGMTLNPSAAHGLEGCTEAQIGIGTANPVSCPGASEIGTVAIETPVLPKGSLTGKVYLGLPPTGGPITGSPFTIYLDAESERYGVSVRLKGLVTPDPSTGRLTATFSENPEQPVEDVVVTSKGGARAPLANPLICFPAPLSAFTPYTEQAPASVLLSSPFSPGAGSVCSTTAPFSLSQSTQSQPATAGGYTSYAFNLARADAQQYLSSVKTVLPPGLVGVIASVPLCGEPQAALGTCSSASQIGTATATAGAGPEPYTFTGPVFLTGPYNGAPYGLSIAIPTAAGPFNFGTVVNRATISVDPHTARVIVSGAVQTIVKGVPVRLKGLTVLTNRPRFLLNPTNCGVLATESTLTSTFGATQNLASPFQVGNCNALTFTPKFSARTSAKASKANGASLETTINQPGGQANVRSVQVQLPEQLPSRLTTLQKACPEATFAANPSRCPAGSLVGGARANTPVLPGKMTGPAYLVSHGGAGFPDLDLVLEANGVRVIVVGNTEIKKGITTTTFKTIPDVPVTSVTVDLPVGPHSALAAIGNLCAVTKTVTVRKRVTVRRHGHRVRVVRAVKQTVPAPLLMPTTITAQNGKVVKQNTKISVAGCGVEIVGQRVSHNTLFLTVKTLAAGRVTASGTNLSGVSKRLGRAENVTLEVPLSRSGRERHRPLRVRVRVGFVPKKKAEPSSAASTTVTFRR